MEGKLTTDTLWNFGAFGLMAVAGAAINLFLAGHRGAEALGIFNQVYAVYVILALLAALGVHDSAQKHAAQLADRPEELAGLTRGALWITLLAGAAATAALALCSGGIGAAAGSDAVGRGVLVVAPGLLLFALNKTLLGVLNGLRRMRAFALAQGARALVILLVVIAVGVSPLPHWALPIGFTAAELLLLPALLVALSALWRTPSSSAAAWRGTHLRFGLRALPNSLLAESFIRVDVIMLGLLLTDIDVGIYSFAALFVEGIYQVAVVVRTVTNPVLVGLLHRGELGQLSSLCRRMGAISLVSVLAVSLGVLLGFPLLARWIDASLVSQAQELLWVLLPGLWIYALFIPSDQLLLLDGQPGSQSALMSVNIALNAGLNLILITWLGLRGAAVATALSFAASAVTLNLAAWSRIGTRLPLLLDPAKGRTPPRKLP